MCSGNTWCHNASVLTQDDGKKIAAKLNVIPTPGRRHDLVVVRYKGRYVTQFGISRNSKEQPHDYIPRQMYLTRKQCEQFIDCSISLDEYVAILKEKGKVSD